MQVCSKPMAAGGFQPKKRLLTLGDSKRAATPDQPQWTHEDDLDELGGASGRDGEAGGSGDAADAPNGSTSQWRGSRARAADDVPRLPAARMTTELPERLSPPPSDDDGPLLARRGTKKPPQKKARREKFTLEEENFLSDAWHR